MRSPFTAFLIAILSSLLALQGCAPPSAPPPLRVGTNLWVGYEPLYLARSLGHYSQTPIQMVEFTSTTEVMRALRAGEIEAAGLTLDEAIYLVAEGLDLRVVMVFDYSSGGDALMTRPDITSLEGLRNKRVGVENSAVGALMLQAVLEAGRLGLEDVSIQTLTANEQVAAYQNGRVDAVITFEPNMARLRTLGAHNLFNSRAIPGRIMDVLVVRTEAMASRREPITSLIKGYFTALGHLHAQPQDAHLRMSARLGDNVAAQLDGIHQPDLSENKAILSQLDDKARQLASFMLTKGLLPKKAEAQGLADPSYLPAN